MTGSGLLRHVAPSRLAALAATRTGIVALTTGGSMIVRMGSSIILTRLLAPEAFGLVGIVNSIFITLVLLTDLGFQSYVVRHHRGDEPHFRNVIWTIHAWRGLGLTILTMGMAPFVSAFMQKPELTWPFIALSSTFLLMGLASLSLMTALRHDASRKLSLFDLAIQIFQTISCILIALWIRNVWAIILSMILQNVVRSAASYWLFPDAGHRLASDKEIRKDFFAFSRVVMASSALSLVLFQCDKIVLGRLLTLSEFGLYAIALNLASAPTSFADSYISRVSFPVYAATWRNDPAQMRSVYYSVGRLPSLLYAFLCGALVGGAGLTVAILYDPRYQGAALMLSLLSIGSALRFPNFAAAEVQTAVGKVKGTLQANVIRLAWIAIAGTIGYQYFGAFGVVGAVGLMEVPALLFNWLALRRLDILDLRKEFAFIAIALTGAGMAFAFAETVRHFLPRL